MSNEIKLAVRAQLDKLVAANSLLVKRAQKDYSVFTSKRIKAAESCLKLKLRILQAQRENDFPLVSLLARAYNKERNYAASINRCWAGDMKYCRRQFRFAREQELQLTAMEVAYAEGKYDVVIGLISIYEKW